MSKPVPNRLGQVDDDLLEDVAMVLYDGKGYRLKRLRSLVRMAYLRGYCDGINDHICSCQIAVSGDTREQAIERAIKSWNRRV